MIRQLGVNQGKVLADLVKRGGEWYQGCGWYFGNHSLTAYVLESLVKHGLVEKTLKKKGRYGHYKVTSLGRERHDIYARIGV